MSRKPTAAEDDEEASEREPEAAQAQAQAAAPADAAPGSATAPPSPESLLAEARRLAAEQSDLRLRALAELENVRRAARQDVEQARRYGASPVLGALLEVLDNLQRALAHPPAGLDAEFLQGLRQMEAQFLAVLAAHGVSPVPAEVGGAFDPALHRAILEQESSEHAPGRIVMLALPGYRLHDRLLREAQVIVARKPG
ncbi:MAG: nucleotide exchange factor GrpE [Planctomycetota bacterium]